MKLDGNCRQGTRKTSWQMERLQRASTIKHRSLSGDSISYTPFTLQCESNPVCSNRAKQAPRNKRQKKLKKE